MDIFLFVKLDKWEFEWVQISVELVVRCDCIKRRGEGGCWERIYGFTAKVETTQQPPVALNLHVV